MTTQSRCWECGTLFTRDFGSFKCNVCHQAEKQAANFAEESQRNREHAAWLVREKARLEAIQNKPAPVYYTWITKEEMEEFQRNHVRPSEEELQKKKEVKRMNILFSLLVDSSLPLLWVFLWMITSGWVTVVGFIAALIVPFYLNEKHSLWKTKNAKYLYQI